MSDCPRPLRADGSHSWRWWGDDPYLVCYYCGQIQDALDGRVIERGRPEPAFDEVTCPHCAAPPSQPCQMSNGKVRHLGPHQRRIDAAARPAGARR